MPPPDEVRPSPVQLSLVRQWIAKADVDFRTAERLLADAEPIRASIAFECQQAAEKYLKCLLTNLGIQTPRTHDLRMLV